ncbi:MAG: Ig-like domain-containing protein [Gemmatimonadetes bacterium]|nr:Ig-like domain-containing protein [Gemmatimonadota bacterium]
MSLTNASIIVGASIQASATLRDAAGNALSARSVTWSSSNQAVATVSSTGLITGLVPGSSVITATSEGVSGSTTVTVTPPPVASVQVTLASLSIVVGTTAQALATAKDASGNTLAARVFSWSSSNPAVATVTSGGLVTGIATGTTLIIATSEGISGSVAATVTPPPVASVQVTLAAAAISPGGTAQASAALRDAAGNSLSGRTITWATSNQAIATVSATGAVTGVAPGTATITATSEGVTGAAAVAVVPQAVATVTVSSAQTTLTVGGTTQLNATVRDVGGATLADRPVSWATSTSAIATVSPTGLVTAVSAGVAIVTATSEGKVGSLQLTVLAATPASVTVSPSSMTLTLGQTATLTATVRDAALNILTNQAVTWSSSNPAAVTVLQSGQMTAVGAGTATISATSGGRSGTASVTVTATPVASITLSASAITMAAGEVRVVIATAKDAAGNVLSGRSVAWTSTDLNVVDGSVFGDTAVITGLVAGSAVIGASVEGKSASVVVTVVAPSSSVCSAIAGASLVGDDGQYLGRFTNRFDSQSVLNQFGNYGSQYSSTSTNNKYGQYGSAYSSLSARNPYASRPPIIVKNGQALAFYTTNQFKTPGVSPAYALTCSFP